VSETKIVEKVNKFSKEADDGNKSYLVKAAELDAQGRPANTYNLILPVINLLSGMELNNPQDYIIYPRKGGYRYIAEVLSALVKHTMDVSDGNYAQSMQFLDGITANKGWVKADISYEFDPINGEIIIKRVSPFDIREDPNMQEYSINSANYIIQLYWSPKDAIINLYPKHKRKLSRYLDNFTGEDVIDFTGKTVKTIYCR